MSGKKWPEAHPDVIRTALPYLPSLLGVKVIEDVAEFREIMAPKPGQELGPAALEMLETMAGLLERGSFVLILEAYPEAYGGFIHALQESFASMVPFVAGQRVKRNREN